MTSRTEGETRACADCGGHLNDIEWQFDECPGSASGNHRIDAEPRTADPDTDPDEILTPYTVEPGQHRGARVCWLNREPVEAGTAAFLDSNGMLVCAKCAAHCTRCSDEDCDHPRYAYAIEHEYSEPETRYPHQVPHVAEVTTGLSKCDVCGQYPDDPIHI